MPLGKAKYARKFKGEKNKEEGAVSLYFSLNDPFSLVESSADSRWLHSSLLICAPLAHWLFVHSATYLARGASFTEQGPCAEGWQQALVLLAFPQPMGTRGEGTGESGCGCKGRRGDLENQVEVQSSKRGPVARKERK